MRQKTNKKNSSMIFPKFELYMFSHVKQKFQLKSDKLKDSFYLRQFIIKKLWGALDIALDINQI